MEGVTLAQIYSKQEALVSSIHSKQQVIQVIKGEDVQGALKMTLADIEELAVDTFEILSKFLLARVRDQETFMVDLVNENRLVINRRIEEELVKIRNKSMPYTVHKSAQQAIVLLSPLIKDNALPVPPARKATWQEDALRIEQELLCDRESELHKDFSLLLKEIAELTKTPHFLRSPSVFLSYAWPMWSRPYESWVQPFLLRFYDHLHCAGATVMLDLNDSRMGRNTMAHMERINDVDFVILFGTESLQDKSGAQAGPRMVQIELNLINGRLLASIHSTVRPVIPVLISGSIPSSFQVGLPVFNVITSMIDREGITSSYLIELRKIMEQIFSVPTDPQNEGRVAWNVLWEVFKEKHALNYQGLDQKSIGVYVQQKEAPLERELKESHEKSSKEMLDALLASKKKK